MKLLVAGAGGHGRVVADAAQRSGAFTEIAFLDDRFPQVDRSGEWPVVGRLRDLLLQAVAYGSCVAAFGDPQLRLRTLDEAAALGFVLPVVLHPSAIVGRGVRFGAGTVVLAGAIVNIGAVIGRGAIVNTGAVVEHDCSLGDGVHVCPGACIAGEVSIGRCSWIGIGASIIQRVTIGENATVGAGGVCIRNVGDGQVVVGVPAKEIHP